MRTVENGSFIPLDFITDGEHIVIAIDGSEPIFIDPGESSKGNRPVEVRLGRTLHLAKPVLAREAALEIQPDDRQIGFLKSEIDRAYDRRAYAVEARGRAG